MSNLVIFAGAGASQQSGLQTFRGTEGLWNDHRIDVICDESTWKRNRHAVIDFYQERRDEIARARPNAFHGFASWAQKYHRASLITTNIDDLFDAAGCRDVLHVHGRIDEMRCEACGTIMKIGFRRWNSDDRCELCSSRKAVRPNVVFFHGEAPLYRQMYRTLDALDHDDMLIVVGASGLVVPIHDIAATSCATTILCDSNEALEGRYDIHLKSKAVEAVPRLKEIVRDHFRKSRQLFGRGTNRHLRLIK